MVEYQRVFHHAGFFFRLRSGGVVSTTKENAMNNSKSNLAQQSKRITGMAVRKVTAEVEP